MLHAFRHGDERILAHLHEVTADRAKSFSSNDRPHLLAARMRLERETLAGRNRKDFRLIAVRLEGRKIPTPRTNDGVFRYAIHF